MKLYVESNDLYHYGVLGMKWGVRRKQKSLDYAIAEIKAKNKRADVRINRLKDQIKATTDKEYKKSDDYAENKKAYRQQKVQDFVYGKEGSLKVDTLKQQGYSDKVAKAKVKTEQILKKITKTALATNSNRKQNNI